MSDAVVLKTAQARVDLAACYLHIAERSLEAAGRFRTAAESSFADLARRPGLGVPYETANPRLHGLRCGRIGRFRNYLVFYRAIDNGIEVIRVLHAARDLEAILDEEE